jgi:hypothetical protein
MRIAKLLLTLTLALVAGSVSSTLAASQNQGPALGLVAKAQDAKVGNTAVTDGATIYSGDYLSTDQNGSLLLRIGALSLELQGASSMHIYSAPYGAIAELDSGTVVYTTPGNNQNVVIVADDVRVTPFLSVPDLGRVSINDPCNMTVFSQRGQASVQTGSESRVVEEGKSYRVRGENEISYRKYVSPDANDYHDYHGHKPCAPIEMAKGHAPIAAGQSRFLLVTGIVVGTATGIGVWKALESPDRP